MIKSKPRKKVSKRSTKTFKRNPDIEKRQKVKNLLDEIKFFLRIIESQESPNISELIRVRDMLDTTTYLDRYPNFNLPK